MVSSSITIGVDIGQRVDPTAIAVVERQPRVEYGAEDGSQRRVWHHTARYLARLPLGTPYPDVAERLAQIAARVLERTGQRPSLFLDATGVGQPVVGVLSLYRVPAWLMAVYFTYGDRRIVEHAGQVTLGKAWLVSRLQALFQGGRLHLPPGHPEAETLTRELLDYEIRVDKNANDTYGAFRVGSHDDLVTALGLATQEDDDSYARAFGLSGMLSASRDSGTQRKPAAVPAGPAGASAAPPITSLAKVLGQGWRRRR